MEEYHQRKAETPEASLNLASGVLSSSMSAVIALAFSTEHVLAWKMVELRIQEILMLFL